MLFFPESTLVLHRIKQFYCTGVPLRFSGTNPARTHSKDLQPSIFNTCQFSFYKNWKSVIETYANSTTPVQTQQNAVFDLVQHEWTNPLAEKWLGIVAFTQSWTSEFVWIKQISYIRLCGFHASLCIASSWGFVISFLTVVDILPVYITSNLYTFDFFLSWNQYTPCLGTWFKAVVLAKINWMYNTGVSYKMWRHNSSAPIGMTPNQLPAARKTTAWNRENTRPLLINSAVSL